VKVVAEVAWRDNSLRRSRDGATQATSIRPGAASEFSSICGSLQALALVEVGGGRAERTRRVTLRIADDDVMFALQGSRFFRTVLVDELTSK